MNPITMAPTAQGKVRDLYDLGDRLLLVATDRISAFDYVLKDEIPYKGQVLTQLSCFWFELLDGVVENHLVSSDVADLPEEFKPWSEYLRGRFMLVKKAQMFPIECIVRGYLTGSGFKDYLKTGTVCGIELAGGLENSAKLPTTLYTPSTKAEIGDHDENIDFDRSAALLEKNFPGRGEEYARTIRDGTLALYSSRFWSVDDYEVGREQPSFDKQFVRNWLNANWDRTGEPPHLPQDIIEKTSEKYIQAYEKLTGRAFER